MADAADGVDHLQRRDPALCLRDRLGVVAGVLRLAARHRLHGRRRLCPPPQRAREGSEEHTSELQSLMRISYAVFCLKKKKNTQKHIKTKYRQKESRQKNHNDKDNNNYNTRHQK